MSERSDTPATPLPVVVLPDRVTVLREAVDAVDRPSVHMRRYAPRDRIFQFGGPVDTVFELVRGCVVITAPHGTGRRRIVDFVQPGRLFGFTAQAHHRFTAVAATAATVCCLNLALARRNDRVAAWIDREMLAEIDRLRDVATLLLRGAAIERIAGLFSLSASPETSGVIHLPVTRSEIADLLGLTVETVCRNVTKLKRDGILVEEGGGVWRIADAPRLALLAAAIV